ncbi:MAG: DUF1015 domain-containing protein [Oscillospiraceae bacterium]|nr:DUF1015 domain-containing protein [Oscillospiraceae bacterium]
MKELFIPGDLLLPAENPDKWSVIACDQHTSEPEYWENCDAVVGDSPSALRMILPEVYLGKNDDERLENIAAASAEYAGKDIFRAVPNAYIYVRRQLSGRGFRRGLLGLIDLEDYSYEKGSDAPIRSTEGTVLERIPPRQRVREATCLETSHVLLLADDPEDKILGPIDRKTGTMTMLYDFELMAGGGRITGWLVEGSAKKRINAALEEIYFRNPLSPVLAMGDGNHSAASAKAAYEKLKEEIGPEAAAKDPRRYLMCELNNIHDDSLSFEPIHRLITGCDEVKLLKWLRDRQSSGGHPITCTCAAGDAAVILDKALSPLPVGAVQKLLDEYLAENQGEIDYIHGEDTLRKLSAAEGCVGFILPAPDKFGFFEALAADGALPRKTFSMGEACDKRYYLETRRLK